MKVMKDFMALGVSIVLVIGLCLLPTTARATGTGGQWIEKCLYQFSLPDDPILFHNQPGASVENAFEGNSGTNAYSTSKLLRTTGTTNCNSGADKAAYWNPGLLVNGVDQDPVDYQNYYVGTVSNLSAIQPYPKNFSMTAGDPNSPGPQSTDIVYWGCGDGSPIGTKDYIPDCRPYTNQLFVHVIFPSCWDGVGHKVSSMAYPLDKTCPAGNPIPVVGLIERITWSPAPDPTQVMFTNGPYYQMNGSFMNGWVNHDQYGHGLKDLIDNCVKTGVNCAKPEP